MKHTGLMLPHKCQTLGWIIIVIPFVLFGIVLLLHLFCTESQFIHLCERYSRILVMILYLCVPIGGAILCFSREKEEDEMIRNIRLRAIGMMAGAELILCAAWFVFYAINSICRFDLPEFDYPVFYFGHFVFCLQFPFYFLLFKIILWINRRRNEE